MDRVDLVLEEKRNKDLVRVAFASTKVDWVTSLRKNEIDLEYDQKIALPDGKDLGEIDESWLEPNKQFKAFEKRKDSY